MKCFFSISFHVYFIQYACRMFAFYAICMYVECWYSILFACRVFIFYAVCMHNVLSVLSDPIFPSLAIGHSSSEVLAAAVGGNNWV